MQQRRQFLRLAALGGGVVYLNALSGCAATAKGYGANNNDFYFAQLSDTHWGFSGPPNPDASGTLKKAVLAVNALEDPPDFIVFTGDLTHTTDDPVLRRQRMAEFRDIVAGLKVRNLRFMPGEHDASLDRGAAFREFFGDTFYSFDHKGVHFVVVDNVSDPGSNIGAAQLAWMKADLARFAKDTPVVVFTHRPLFDLAPRWDWATRDGAQALEILMSYTNVTVFYGHIHQEHHHMTGHIAHHSAKSLIFPQPAPGSQEKRLPVPWNPEHPYQGLGFREVELQAADHTFELHEFGVNGRQG